jgi:Protein of unknown function (DUF1616)
VVQSSRKAPVKSTLLDRLKGRQVPASDLVDEMERGGYSRDETIGALIELQNHRVLAVDEPRPYSSLLSFAFSPYSLWFWGVVGAVAASVGLITVGSGVVLYARYVFGSALVLFLPGYALIEALYPKHTKGPQGEKLAFINAELDDLTRFALSIGLSLALVPLTGLVLNYTPFGIRLLPVTISIAGLTLALLAVALKRKHDYYKLAKGVL